MKAPPFLDSSIKFLRPPTSYTFFSYKSKNLKTKDSTIPAF